MKTVVKYSYRFSGSARIVGLCLVLSTASVDASDQHMGAHGPTWNIAEPDMRLAIAADAHGVDWDSHREHLQAQAESYTADLLGWELPVAEHTQTRHYTPMHVQEEDVWALMQQEDGTYEWDILYPAGTYVNPLETLPPPDWLLFVDLRIPSQVSLTRELLDAYPVGMKVIATAGDPGELAKETGVPIFFANRDWFFTHLQVTHVPTLAGVRKDNPHMIEVTHFAFPHSPETLLEWLP